MRFFWAVLLLPLSASAAEKLTVDPGVGNSGFSAVFDAPLGERINAVSSAVGCELQVDDAGVVLSGKCTVPLTSIMVDNEPTKTEHFQQWATNKASDPKACTLQVMFDGVKLDKALAANAPASFKAELPFTICGRAREGGGRELVTGTALLFPAGSYGKNKTVKIRAQIRGFDREAYGVTPAKTQGWLARVQSLANVVAKSGDVEVSLFAVAK